MSNPPGRLTFEHVRKTLMAVGCVIRKKDGEYRVVVKGDNEDSAYYTNDLQDALNTGIIMASGYADNPRRDAARRAPQRGTCFGKEVIEIRYIHADDGKAYKHDFGKGTKMEALPDGSVRLFNPKHRIHGEY